MSEHEELLEVLLAAEGGQPGAMWTELATAILSAGYRRQPEPREVTTVAGLDALPVESVVMSEGIAYQKDGTSVWDGAGRCWSATQIDLPAVILFTPTPSTEVTP